MYCLLESQTTFGIRAGYGQPKRRAADKRAAPALFVTFCGFLYFAMRLQLMKY